MQDYFKYKLSNIPVVYEDEWLLIVDKPPGLLTIPTPKKDSRTLTSILNEEMKKKGGVFNLHPCHRLDKETSGLIIYAKGKSAQQKMMGLFHQRKVDKVYIAFVQGNLARDEGEIKNRIEGKNALTRYKVCQRKKDFSVVEIRPLTGRTNQIRIHFKQIGYPIVGDDKFVFRKDFALRSKHLCLQAKALRFSHPVNAKMISLDIPLSRYLGDFLGKHQC
ncbi:MAG: RNA pseudouridine synthase [Candidatus Omnitrophota bacterium]